MKCSIIEFGCCLYDIRGGCKIISVYYGYDWYINLCCICVIVGGGDGLIIIDVIFKWCVY